MPERGLLHQPPEGCFQAFWRCTSAMRRLVTSLFCLTFLKASGLPARQSPAITSVLISVTDPTGMDVAGARP
jgi:hypothetical protein